MSALSMYKVNVEYVAIITGVISILYVLPGSYGYCTVRVTISISAYYYATYWLDIQPVHLYTAKMYL